MRVHEIMKDLIKTDINTKVNQAAIMMTENNVGSVVIEENENIIGIISVRDVSLAINDLILKKLLNE